MKKIISVFLLTVFFMIALVPTVSANCAEEQLINTSSHIEYYEDGSYTVITVKQISPITRSNVYTAEKLVHLYNSKDELQWTYTLIGTFLVDYGISVVCTDSTYSYIIYNDSWSLTAHSNSYYDNLAVGTATFKKKVLFITTNTHDIEAEVGCDIYGNLLS